MKVAAKTGACGWMSLVGAFLLLFTSVGLGANGLLLFYVPVAGDLGFTQTAFSLYMTLGTIPMMIFAPFVGKFWSKNFHRLRFMIILCGLLTSVLIIGYGMCSHLWQFYVISIVRGFVSGFITILPASMLINYWFPEKRAFMTSIAFMGSSIGGMFFTQLSGFAIGNFDWRTAYILLGSVCVVLYLIIAFLVQPPRKLEVRDGTESADTAEPTEEVSGYMLGEAIRMPAFWMMILGFSLGALASMGIQGCISSSVQLDYGYTAKMAATCVTIFNGTCIFGKLLMGWLYDRLGIKFGLLYICVMLILCSVSLLLSGSVLFGILASIFFGLGNMVGTITSTTVTPDIFGLKDYSSIYGVLTLFVSGSMALGLTLSSAIYDLSGSYRPAWYLYIAFNIAYVGLLLLSRKIVHSKKQSAAERQAAD